MVSQEPFAIVNSGDLKLFDELSLLGSEHAAVARLNELIEARIQICAARFKSCPHLNWLRNMVDTLRNYTFLPWLRQGLAAGIDEPDNLGGSDTVARQSVQ